ncbi:hypothetical protein [Paradesulfitobacterium ferrireducens]|uniref:hypothetical protein n=1 Tax=Paradesulfitobacterium ferrireducens TaxID=2816476 RepID=UPI001A906416|nr:hypothetical protein [Paradesulfitobacterium ferrireducens]
MNHEDFQGLILEQFNRVFGELADINSKVGGLEKRFDELEEKVLGLDAKVSRNTLLLERTDKNG